MQIKKRNHKKDLFTMDKIKTSINNSANDINFPLTDSDVRLVLRRISQVLDTLHPNGEDTSVYEVRGIIYCVLIELGFKKVANSYMDTKFNK